MSFYKLNSKKILPTLGLTFSITGIIGLFIYLMVFAHCKKHNINIEVSPFIYAYFGYTIFFYLMLFLSSWYSFYRSRKMIKYILSLNVLDNNEITVIYVDSLKWYFFTTEKYVGKIMDYPVYYTFIAASKYNPPRILCTFNLFKFKRVYKEVISFELDRWFGDPKLNIKYELLKFVENLNTKNYVKADFDKVIEELSK